MPYRSTKEKAEAQKAARQLYVVDGLSLKEIREQTGETMKTLRSWYTLGDWETLRGTDAGVHLNRLERLRDSLLAKAEAQIKEDKLPHTELGLVYKLERLMVQREKKDERDTAILGNTLQYLVLYLEEHDLELARALANHFDEFARWIVEQDLTRPPLELIRQQQELKLARSMRELTSGLQRPSPQMQRRARQMQKRTRQMQKRGQPLQELFRSMQELTSGLQRPSPQMQRRARP